MTIKRYFYLFTGLSLFVATLLAGFNYFVDPYIFFQTSRISGLNEQKPASINRSDLYKPYGVQNTRPETLVVGNSRPEMGLDPESICWPEGMRGAYSLTFPGRSFYGQVRALYHGVATGNVQHIFLAVDFADFIYLRETHEQVTWPSSHSDFYERMSVDENFKENEWRFLIEFEDALSVLFSLDALTDSIYTLFSQSADGATRTSLGFNPAKEYGSILRHEGAWVLFEQKLGELDKRFSVTGMSIYDTKNGDSVEFEALKRVIQLAADKQIKLTIFINPYHYSYLEAIRNAGYWNEFEDFKKNIQRVVDDNGNGQVALWDFSRYTSYTVSRIPKKEDGSRVEPNWFWEPAHYKSELGNVMLSEMLTTQCTQNPETLGHVLNSINMDDYFKEEAYSRASLLTQIQ